MTAVLIAKGQHIPSGPSALGSAVTGKRGEGGGVAELSACRRGLHSGDTPVQASPVQCILLCSACKQTELIPSQPTHSLQVHFDIDFHFHFQFPFQFLFLFQFLLFDYLLGLIRNAISLSVGVRPSAAVAECRVRLNSAWLIKVHRSKHARNRCRA